MLLTPEQLHEISQIIELHHQAFIANVISPEAVTADTLQKLQDAGMLNVQVQGMEQAYLYGQALQLAQEPVLGSMGYDAFKEYVKKNPIPLTPVEKQAVAMAQMTAGMYCRGLGNTVDKDTGAVLIEADQELRWRMETEIQNKTAENIAKRETIQQLKSKLGWATGDWTRNWARIAITEKHNAMERGRADVIRKEVGEDARVFRRAMPDCCDDCAKLYTDPGTNTPYIFKLSTLEANGTNVGLKRKDWKPVLGATHPHCFEKTTEIYTHRGSIPIADVRVGDFVLGVDSQWQPVTALLRSEFDGELVVLRGADWELAATPNHPFWVGDSWVDAACVEEGQHLIQKVGVVDFPLSRAGAQDEPSMFQQVLCLARVFTGFLSTGVPVTAIDLKGQLYVGKGEIQVKDVDGTLQNGKVAPTFELFAQEALDVREGFALPSLRAFDQVFRSAGATPSSLVCGSRIRLALRKGCLCLPDQLGVSSVAGVVTGVEQAPDNNLIADFESLTYLVDREQIFEVQLRDDFGGDVDAFSVAAEAVGVAHVLSPLSGSQSRHSQTSPFGAGAGEPQGMQASLHGSAASSNSFGDFAGQQTLVEQPRQSALVDVYCHCTPVIARQKRQYKGTVYNLSVAGSESYFAGGLLVHNCQCITTEMPPGWGFDEDGDMVPGGETVDYVPPKPAKGEAMQKAFPTVRTLDVQGMRINIEHPAGSIRPWMRADGSQGSTIMLAHYGYVRGTTGADDDEIDVYVGPDPRAPYVYVIHQLHPETGQYDETKCMVGFQSETEAVAMWRRHYDRPDRFYGWCEPVGVDAFKRQVESTADEQGGKPRLVVPLRKAGITADIVGADSNYGNKAVVTGGGGPNVAFKIPWRASKKQVTDEDLKTWAGMPVEGLKRDPDIYVFQNPANQVRKLELPDNYARQIPESGEIEQQREEILNRFMLRRPLRNAADLRKGDPPIIEVGKKGGKIIGKTKSGKNIYLTKDSGASGGLHALGLVAEHLHGKVVPNSQDTNGRTLKVPQSDLNEKALSAINTALGLDAPIIKGGKYYVVPLTAAQLDKVKNLHFADPEKKTATPAPSSPSVWEGPAPREEGWQQYADDVTTIDAPTPPDRFITRGQPVVATVGGKEIKTELRGTNMDGDPTVTVNGERHAMLWKGVKRAEPATNKAALHKVAPENIVKAGDRQRKLVEKVMQLEVCHAVREGELVPLPAGEVAEHYRSNNEEIYLVGGIVRDLLAGTTKTSNTTDAELEQQMNDVDYVTSANPARMHKLLEQLGVSNHGRALRWGCAITKQPDMPGLDMACLASGTGTNHPAVEVTTPRGKEIWEPPADFDHDMAADSERRDFTCNALMYDTANHAIIDPTGQGIGDAQARVLRLTNFTQDNLDTNQLLCVRFWKFRSRGYKAEAQTLKLMQQQAEKVMSGWAEDIKEGAGTMAWHIAGKGPDPEKELAKFRAAMKADGMDALYAKYIEPMHGKILKVVEKNKKDQKQAMKQAAALLAAQKAASKAKKGAK